MPLQKKTQPQKTKRTSKRTPKVLSVLLDFTVDCLRCMRPVAISAVEPSARCRSCLYELELEESLFRGSAVGCVRSAIDGEGGRSSHFDGDFTFVSRTRVLDPTCPGCGAGIDAPALVEAAHVCACGVTLGVRPSDDLVRAIHRNAAAIAGERPRVELEAVEPVAFACPRCKASLVTDRTSRSVECAACSGFVDVPELLWNTLHPASPRPAIFLLLQGGR